MKFWFVSRERFDQEHERCAKLETELAELHRALIPQLQPKPAPVEPLILNENTDFSKVLPIHGKPTIAFVTAAANRAAAERAPGSIGIAQELHDAQIARIHSKAVNG